MSACPTCGAGVTTDGAEQGEILTCGDCGTELEVLGLDPIQIALAPETKEDWGE
ncbi:MAG: lysine biosynthesis protein LysW [Euryarchaeota archaeon RBG_16_68_13]|nr:MAG: lysine biosynthesis protein LysW [Euryarchaeota archaeon RBG_16_68_13]